MKSSYDFWKKWAIGKSNFFLLWIQISNINASYCLAFSNSVEMLCYVNLVSFQIFIFETATGPFEEHFVQCMDMGYGKVAWGKRVYSIVSLLASFILPLFIMGIAYSLISGTIIRKSRDFRGICVFLL